MIHPTDRFEISDADNILILRALNGSRIVLANPHCTMHMGDNDALRDLLEARPKGVGQPDGDQRVWLPMRKILAAVTVSAISSGWPRCSLDVNRERSSPEAYDHDRHPEFGITHDNYHGGIDLMLGEGPQPSLLIDLHGVAEVPAEWAEELGGMPAVIMGTRHRTTVHTDIDLEIGDLLNEAGIPTFVPGPSPLLDWMEDPEHGEFTVVRAGARGADAVQMALAPWLRDLASPGPAIEFAQIMAAILSRINSDRYGC